MNNTFHDEASRRVTCRARELSLAEYRRLWRAVWAWLAVAGLLAASALALWVGRQLYN